MAELKIPTLTGTVGGAKAKNDLGDVKIVQRLLNAAVEFGEVPGFIVLAVDGKATDTLLKLTHAYQGLKGLGAPKNFKDVLIEPGKKTLKQLAENPYIDERWSEWDTTIKAEVDAYNKKFKGTKGYIELDWRFIKAQVWTEVLAGPSDKANWETYPMQIGRFKADPGFEVVARELDHSELVVDKAVRNAVKADHTKAGNIAAGVAYDVHLGAKYQFVEVIDDPAKKILALGHRLLPDFAKAEKTTVDILMRLNKITIESAKKLHPGDKLEFLKGHNEWQIVGWQPWKVAIKNYNGGGDSKYMSKFEKRLDLITKKWK